MPVVYVPSDPSFSDLVAAAANVALDLPQPGFDQYTGDEVDDILDDGAFDLAVGQPILQAHALEEFLVVFGDLYVLTHRPKAPAFFDEATLQ